MSRQPGFESGRRRRAIFSGFNKARRRTELICTALPGQRIQQVFVGKERLQPNRHYPTTYVTEQGVANKYGRNRQQGSVRAVEAMKAYLARHSPMDAELRATFVAA